MQVVHVGRVRVTAAAAAGAGGEAGRSVAERRTEQDGPQRGGGRGHEGALPARHAACTPPRRTTVVARAMLQSGRHTAVRHERREDGRPQQQQQQQTRPPRPQQQQRQQTRPPRPQQQQQTRPPIYGYCTAPRSAGSASSSRGVSRAQRPRLPAQSGR